MSAEWMAQQLSRMSHSRPTAPDIPRYNPRPAGVIRPGSATNLVLALLCKRRPAFLTHHQIMDQTKRTTKAVSWALIYLRAQGYVEITGDGRNARYQRYRATEKGVQHAAATNFS